MADHTSFKIAYVTGTDANRALNTGILLESFKEFLPDQLLHIADFGMADHERDFWRRVVGKDRLLRLEQSFPHSWFYKAAISNFFDTDKLDAIVWLDADMVIRRPLHDQISKLLSQMIEADESIAICPDVSKISINDFIIHHENRGWDLSLFKGVLDQLQGDIGEPYLNTGFFILRDWQLAANWGQIVAEQEEWLLFEQNCFNALASNGTYAIRKLPTAVWNVHGRLLADVDVSLADGPENILHTTSAEQEFHIENEIQYPIGDQVLPGWFKLFTDPDLKSLQQHYLLAFLKNNLQHLAETGMLKPAV